MAPPASATDLITPLEPSRAQRSAAPPARASGARHAVYANAFRRLEAAVASSCGSQHAVNEDAHSALDGAARLFVVADGVGGGAMAQTASCLLVATLHDALHRRDRSTGQRVSAGDARRRPGDRRHDRAIHAN